jgi:hypothetical protein
MKRTTSPSRTKVFQEESDLQNTLPETSKFANLRKKNGTKKEREKRTERKREKETVKCLPGRRLVWSLDVDHTPLPPRRRGVRE